MKPEIPVLCLTALTWGLMGFVIGVDRNEGPFAWMASFIAVGGLIGSIVIISKDERP